MNPIKFAETLSNITKLPQDLRKLNLLSKLSQQYRSYLYRRPVYGNIQLRIFSIRSGNLFWIEFLYLNIVDCKLNKKVYRGFSTQVNKMILMVCRDIRNRTCIPYITLTSKFRCSSSLSMNILSAGVMASSTNMSLQ